MKRCVVVGLSSAFFSLAAASTATIRTRLLVLSACAPAPSSCAVFHSDISSSALYLVPQGCHLSTEEYGSESSIIDVDVSSGEGGVFWVQPSNLDRDVSSAALASTVPVVPRMDDQLRFASSPTAPRVLANLGSGHKIVQFESDAALSHYTSSAAFAFSELVHISLYPEPKPVPPPSVARIAQHLHDLKFQPLISTLLSAMPKKQFKRDVRLLSGENQTELVEENRWKSRHSMSEGGHKASAWILSELSSYGLNCTAHQYRPSFAPMVTCTIEGRNASAGTVVLGAHFDSRGTFGIPTAPGADDDGSGTSLLLSTARLVSKYRLTFERRVIFAAFSGEEQGLLGSQWFAQKLKAEGEDVVLMIQADMIGYRKPGEPLQLAFPPDTLGLREARYLVGNISQIYAPELVVGQTPACCSDHQSFNGQGFASTWVFERNGAIADPMYHNSGDLSEREGYSWDQIHLISQVVLATVLEVAGFAFV